MKKGTGETMRQGQYACYEIGNTGYYVRRGIGGHSEAPRGISLHDLIMSEQSTSQIGFYLD